MTQIDADEGNAGRCEVPCCDRPAVAAALSLCRKHYDRIYVDKKCLVPGCSNRYQARGLCSTHWSRAHHGDPETESTAEALKYFLPAKAKTGKRTKRAKKGKSKPLKAGDVVDTPQGRGIIVAPPKAGNAVPVCGSTRFDGCTAITPEVAAVLAAATEIATALRMFHMPVAQGHAIMRPATGKLVVITPSGHRRRGRIKCEAAGEDRRPRIESEAYREVCEIYHDLGLPSFQEGDATMFVAPETGEIVGVTADGAVHSGKIDLDPAD